MNNIVIDGSVMTLATQMRGRRASHMHEINSTIESAAAQHRNERDSIGRLCREPGLELLRTNDSHLVDYYSWIITSVSLLCEMNSLTFERIAQRVIILTLNNPKDMMIRCC
ncbi:hypothetical protein HZH68_014194 [Vespula germanica]|uniref:Uncharacterized protein n=1 Tax=Vespula germanica TaxID=30212 RepID=A0A834JCD9_VESGE|nr:hypothetical protein HZH68_014194 [Vespula germanica]